MRGYTEAIVIGKDDANNLEDTENTDHVVGRLPQLS